MCSLKIEVQCCDRQRKGDQYVLDNKKDTSNGTKATFLECLFHKTRDGMGRKDWRAGVLMAIVFTALDEKGRDGRWSFCLPEDTTHKALRYSSELRGTYVIRKNCLGEHGNNDDANVKGGKGACESSPVYFRLCPPPFISRFSLEEFVIVVARQYLMDLSGNFFAAVLYVTPVCLYCQRNQGLLYTWKVPYIGPSVWRSCGGQSFAIFYFIFLFFFFWSNARLILHGSLWERDKNLVNVASWILHPSRAFDNWGFNRIWQFFNRPRYQFLD